MTIFKEFGNGGKDRSTEDRRRHRELVEESIKKGIGNIIAEESIIGQSRDKKIKIPIRGLKEYRFIYGRNTPGVGSGDGTESRGDRIAEEKAGQKGGNEGHAGNQEGEDIYETEITIEELINYLFDDLDLPDIDKKKIAELEAMRKFRNLGYQRKGIPPRLAKRRSVIEKIKRKQACRRDPGQDGNSAGSGGSGGDMADVETAGGDTSRDGTFRGDTSRDGTFRVETSRDETPGDEAFRGEISGDETIRDETSGGVTSGGATSRDETSGGESAAEPERFPFMEDDLRYRRVREERRKDFNAVVICIMDVSGSMDQTKKYMARSFYFMLYQFIRLKYSNVEVVFVAHTTTAKEVNETEFFHKGESGGTYISSGYEKALEIIEQRYNPASWNIYAFHCSDGDNWLEDNRKAVEAAQKLCDVCNLFGYGEIVPGYYSSSSTIKSEFQRNIKKKNFAVVTMSRKDDIFPGIKKLLEKE